MQVLKKLDDANGIEVHFDFLNASKEELKIFSKAIPEHNLILVKNIQPDKTKLTKQIHKIGKSYIRSEGLYFYDDDHPEIVRVTNERKNGEKIGLFADGDLCWHADGCLRDRVKQITLILYCEQSGIKGTGITGFCNTRKAYENMSTHYKDLANNIEVQHSAAAFANKQPTVGKNDGGYNIKPDDKEYEIFNGQNSKTNGSTVYKTEQEDIYKPLVHAHPWHGEKSLNFTPSIISNWRYKDGAKLDDTTSTDLWNYLYNHTFQDKFIYKHNWEEGDLIFNDQWYGMHNRTAVSGKRSLWRWHIDNYWVFQ